MSGLRILKYLLPAIGLAAGIGFFLVSTSAAQETIPLKAISAIRVSSFLASKSTVQKTVPPRAMSVIRVSSVDCGGGNSCSDEQTCCGSPNPVCCPKDKGYYCSSNDTCYSSSTDAANACSNYDICYVIVGRSSPLRVKRIGKLGFSNRV